MRFFKIRVLKLRWFRGLCFEIESNKKENCHDCCGDIIEGEDEIYVNEDEIMELNSYSDTAIDFRGLGLVAGVDYEREKYSNYVNIKTEKARKAVETNVVSKSETKGLCGNGLKLVFKKARFGTINLRHAICTNLGLNGPEFSGQSFTLLGEDFDRLVENLTVRDLTK